MRNISLTQRFLRLTLGTAMLSWAIAGGPTWAYISLLLLFTGSWGYCPLKAFIQRNI